MNSQPNIQQAADDLCTISMLPQVTGVSYQQLVDYISAHVAKLLKHDFAALVQLLYRLDISEEKLRYFLHQHKDQMASRIMAELMIERQLQKVETRRLFKKDNNIPDDEKW